jgi:gamma-glutamyltranspeptidase / glutathione hydrolase
MQILGLLDRAGRCAALQAGVPGADWLHAYTEAARLAFADRAQYVADPDFVAAPAAAGPACSTTPTCASARADRPAQPGHGRPGRPGGERWPGRRRPAQPEAGTSHISVVDAEGRAVALTTTIEAAFGARLMSDGGTGLPGGFLLNNQLTDFSFTPGRRPGPAVANRVQPGKRPRSSMSPTLVFDAALALPNVASFNGPRCWRRAASRPPRPMPCASAATSSSSPICPAACR